MANDGDLVPMINQSAPASAVVESESSSGSDEETDSDTPLTGRSTRAPQVSKATKDAARRTVRAAAKSSAKAGSLARGEKGKSTAKRKSRATVSDESDVDADAAPKSTSKSKKSKIPPVEVVTVCRSDYCHTSSS